jgi:pyruvate dehydrogenase E2 component (dihydrolipoamide acetyltransferase)
MTRSFLLLAVAVAALSACNQKTEQPPASSQSAPALPPIAAAPHREALAAAPRPMAAPAAQAAPTTPAAPSEASVTPPESASCLDLVEKASFTEAVPVCVRAAGLDPNNTAVQQALTTARAKSVPSASAAADQASKGAGSALPGALGQKLP